MPLSGIAHLFSEFFERQTQAAGQSVESFRTSIVPVYAQHLKHHFTGQSVGVLDVSRRHPRTQFFVLVSWVTEVHSVCQKGDRDVNSRTRGEHEARNSRLMGQQKGP